MNDPSTLPFSAGELPDETMQEVAVIQTPDHPTTAGSADPNGPRIELHRHESYHQLNQVNVPKVELHQHEHRQQLNQVHVASQVDPQVFAQAADAVTHARTEAAEAVANVRTEAVGAVSEARAYAASVERDATQAVAGARNQVAEVQGDALRRTLQLEREMDQKIRQVREDAQKQAFEAMAELEVRATTKLRQQQEEFDHEKSKLLHELSVATGTVRESHHDTGKENIVEMLSELDSRVKDLCQRQLDFEIQSKALWDEMKTNLESLSDRVSSIWVGMKTIKKLSNWFPQMVLRSMS